MNKAFNNFNWEDAPSTTTPLNAENMNKLNRAINEIDNRVIDTKESTVTFTEADTDADIASGDTHAALFGKIKKRLATIITALATKLDKTSVSNSRAVTEAGFAMDARQGNAAIPGTMAADISTLNSALGTKVQNNCHIEYGIVSIPYTSGSVGQLNGTYAFSNTVNAISYSIMGYGDYFTCDISINQSNQSYVFIVLKNTVSIAASFNVQVSLIAVIQ